MILWGALSLARLQDRAALVHLAASSALGCAGGIIHEPPGHPSTWRVHMTRLAATLTRGVAVSHLCSSRFFCFFAPPVYVSYRTTDNDTATGGRRRVAPQNAAQESPGGGQDSPEPFAPSMFFNQWAGASMSFQEFFSLARPSSAPRLCTWPPPSSLGCAGGGRHELRGILSPGATTGPFRVFALSCHLHERGRG
jgi:hypothetical protein